MINSKKNSTKGKIKVIKRIHPLYVEWMISGGRSKQLIGKYQYVYSSPKGEISLIKLINYFLDGKDIWEIYCLESDLFEDYERFYSKKEAVKRIEEYLL